MVNDGTHDAAYAAVVADFADIVRYTPLPKNVGIADARNETARLARGEYVVFTDDDCEPPSWWLDWLEARINHDPELDIVSGTTLPLWPAKPRFLERVIGHYEFLPKPHKNEGMMLFVTANVAIRRSLFWAHGGFGFGEPFPGAGEDTDLSFRLARAGGRKATDLNWYVCHELSDGLRRQLKRFWRYGYCNVWMCRFTTAPVGHADLLGATWNDHWGNALFQLRRHVPLSKDFSRNVLVRWASIVVASAIWIAYFDGCIAASTARRRELRI